MTVVVVGEPAGDTGEASSRTTLDLPGQQEALVQQIAATGKPYVVVLMNGRPLTIPELAGDPTTTRWRAGDARGVVSPARGRQRDRDALFGKFDPSGKLPMSFPVNVGQIPISYDELPTGRPYDPNNKYTSRYLDVPNAPRVPVRLRAVLHHVLDLEPEAPSSVSRNGTFQVSAKVTNTGSTAGVDVVQLYLHESDTRDPAACQEARGVPADVALAPGQSKTVTFTLGPQNLGFYNDNGQFVVEPGPFDLWVGDSSTADRVRPRRSRSDENPWIDRRRSRGGDPGGGGAGGRRHLQHVSSAARFSESRAIRGSSTQPTSIR